ncbi:MAG: B-box zinc finger protein [Thermodesulfobacteriota bacterium]|nr:B-box zinc finger protein [Thermodesulfobacteriota bacterium]
MSEVKICEVCDKNEAANTCAECGVPLCEDCTKEVRLIESGPGYQIKGATLSAMRSGEKKLKVCPKCMKEVDFM